MNTEQEPTPKQPTVNDWERAECACDRAIDRILKPPFDWVRAFPYIVCAVVGSIIITAWVMGVRSAVKSVPPPSPIQSTQITMFNVGACQYVLVGQDRALAVVHRGDCSNHAAFNLSTMKPEAVNASQPR